MGTTASAEKGQQKTKLNPDNISTVSMALEGQSKSRSRQQLPGSVDGNTANGGNGQVPYSNISKSQLSNPSSAARFNSKNNGSSLGASSGRTMDLNGNNFYPNSVGKNSTISGTCINARKMSNCKFSKSFATSVNLVFA